VSEPLFLVDAHLPFRLVERLRERGYDALHTRELPRGNATPDQEICALSLRERRVVVTKDGDFVHWTYAASTCTGNRGLKSRLSLPAMSLRRHW
jgi:predicted nuclease of predicted toxin-antitoxin system